MNLEKQLRSVLGAAGYFLLMKVLKRMEITIDPSERILIIYRDGKEPARISFNDIEDFVNNVH